MAQIANLYGLMNPHTLVQRSVGIGLRESYPLGAQIPQELLSLIGQLEHKQQQAKEADLTDAGARYWRT